MPPCPLTSASGPTPRAGRCVADEQARRKDALGTVAPRGDVAIIGLACIFPGAPDVRAFWTNIVNKVDCIADASPARWDQQSFYRPGSLVAGEIACRRGGFLPDEIELDPRPFGLMPSTVRSANPDQLLALLCARQAIVDAGYAGRLEDIATEVVLGRGGYAGAREIGTTHRMSVSAQVLRVIESLRPDLSAAQLAELKQELLASTPPLSAETSLGSLPN